MATGGLGSLKNQVFGNANRQQHYRDSLLGLTAYERHLKFITDYVRHYGDPVAKQAAEAAANNPQYKTLKTDYDTLRETYRFIRTEEDDADSSWEVRLAKKYYDRLFKEYCIVDLSRYKESKLGLRWRVQKEVIDGKGQFICGAKGCSEMEGLCSYEVNFSYSEAGQRKQALVKLRLCPSCAYKLNYRKEKQYQKAQVQAGSTQQQHQGVPAGSKRMRAADILDEDGGSRETLSVVPPPAKRQAAAEPGLHEQQATMPADDSVWEHKPVQEATAEEEFDHYFDGMFM